MSTTTIHLPPPPPPPIPSAAHYYITNLGLGYAIAIAFGFLVLFSSLLLISYICIRHRHINHIRHTNNNTGTGSDNNNNNNNGIILPSIIFVDEDANEGNQDVIIGLDQSVINSYPKFTYSKGIKKGMDTLCAICLCEYREAEMMRMMPDCKHCFHLTCVDAWLKLNASCPVCRNSPLPTPLSTPLAEVVPLSQYSDGRHRR